MRKIVWVILLLASYNLAYSQGNPAYCETIYDKAKSLFRKADYDSAIKKLAAYKICQPEQAHKADKLLNQIYQEVNRQRKQAVYQQGVAEKRAITINAQKDSIEKENISNRIATQALQSKALNPTEALLKTAIGLCFSPNNPSLLEIRKSILSDEVLMGSIGGANPYGTICLKRLPGERFATGDASGQIAIWNGISKTLLRSIPVIKGRIAYLENVDGEKLLYAGVENSGRSKRIFSLGMVDINKGTHLLLQKDTSHEFKYLTSMGDSNTIVFWKTNGELQSIDCRTKNTQTIKSIDKELTGLCCWQNTKQIYYATRSAVHSLSNEQPIFVAPEENYISLLDFCEYRADLYIGMGNDLVIYDCLRKSTNLLYPLHDHLITSCKCSEKMGGFMTTSLDGFAALWTPTGNKNRVLKGNKPELYDGLISENANYIVTAGNRELVAQNSDTLTLKYWYLDRFQKRNIKEAHLFGSDCSAFNTKDKQYITGGSTGNLKIWNEDLELVNEIKISNEGISALYYDSLTNLVAFGTFSGFTGTINLAAPQAGEMAIKSHYNYVSSVSIKNGKVYSAGKDGCLYIQGINNSRLDSLYFNVELNSLQIDKSGENILLSAGNSTIIYNFQQKKSSQFKHNQRVFNSQWFLTDRIITVSDNILRIWNTSNTNKPLLAVDNNIRNSMTSLMVDYDSQLIYTGCWSGYIICWDFLGNQRFIYEELASLANTNLIKSITKNKFNAEIVVTDYNGNVSLWRNPVLFLEKELKMTVNCDDFLKLLKR